MTMVLLTLLITRSRIGKSLRAAADNPTAATYMGIDVDRAHRVAFALGTGITAIAGGLLATNYPFHPFVGVEYVIVMYAGVVLGGMGSIIGAFWGGMTIGLVQQMSTLMLPTQIAERGDLRGLSPDHLLPPARFLRANGREDLTMPGLRSLLPVIVFTLLYAALSLSVSNSYYQLVLTLVPVWAVFGLSWNLLSGYTGLISFGHAAFFGIGAYAVALGQIYFDLSPWIMIPVAAMLGGVAGLLIGFPTFRLQGHYFALAMLAYPLAILYVFEWLGFQEITLPIKRDNPIAYMQFGDPRIYTLLALAMMLATILLTRASKDRVSAWRCVRSSRTRPPRKPRESTRWPGSCAPSP